MNDASVGHELQNNRIKNLKHFLDQYYCYEKSYINKNKKAKR